MPDPAYNRYATRRPGRLSLILIVVAVVVAALAAWQLLAVPRVAAVTPGPNTFVNDGSAIVLDVHGLSGLKNVRVLLDGADVTAQARLDEDALTLSPRGLADGPHTVSFSGSSSNLFRRQVRKDWRFTLDTSAPGLKLDGSIEEGRVNTSPAMFSGKTEGYAVITVTAADVTASGGADASGDFAVSIELPDGRSTLSITAADRAGNATVKKLDVYVDAVPPTLKVTQLGKTVRHSGFKVHISARDQLGPPKLTAVLDGKPAKLSGTASKAVLAVKSLAQGRHELSVSAADRGGNEVKDKQTFVVDSTERFGAAVLWPGARGKDVHELQRRLKDAGVYDGRKTGVYDGHTKEAVLAFQARYGLTQDGIVGGTTLNALSGQIIVDLSELRLYLYRDSKLVKSYRVATGQAAYPTPTGSYAIITMIKDPTWLPPNSDWAKDSKPIPPGATNPLGTRWMGTSAPGVGIHGVPSSSDASIGTYASHGCIRMHDWDARDLFDRISIGMPVIIRS